MPNKIIAAIKAWLRAIEDRRALAEMPDYLLNDIGLRRDQIDAGGLWRQDAASANAPQQAKARPSAKVVAIAAAARPENKPAAPEKPLAA